MKVWQWHKPGTSTIELSTFIQEQSEADGSILFFFCWYFLITFLVFSSPSLKKGKVTTIAGSGLIKEYFTGRVQIDITNLMRTNKFCTELYRDWTGPQKHKRFFSVLMFSSSLISPGPYEIVRLSLLGSFWSVLRVSAFMHVTAVGQWWGYISQRPQGKQASADC